MSLNICFLELSEEFPKDQKKKKKKKNKFELATVNESSVFKSFIVCC